MGWGELGLCNIGSVLNTLVSNHIESTDIENTYFVSFVSSSGGNLALLTGGKLSQVAVVITLPVLKPIISIVDTIVEVG